jgi:hypothetical protein
MLSRVAYHFDIVAKALTDSALLARILISNRRPNLSMIAPGPFRMSNAAASFAVIL